MSFGFSVGDFIAVGTLLVTTVRKCQAASKDFEQLSLILQTTSSCVASARSTLEGIYDQLPTIHQSAVASALTGLRNLCVDLDSELDRYAEITPGEVQLAKLQFALLADPRTAESKVTLYLTMLNTCMAIIICDSMTRSKLQPYNLTDLTRSSDPQTGPALPELGNLGLRKSVAEQWTASANPSRVWIKLSPTVSFTARGVYTYNKDALIPEHLPRTDRVEYELSISGDRLRGTAKDSIGTAKLDGQIDRRKDTVRFIKRYTGQYKYLRWEYEGHFTSCGIAGEWHWPKDPREYRYQRGRFAIWLPGDEAAQGADLEDQLQQLEEGAALLTRSMSFNSS